jgi:hypothetical protein
MKRDNKQMPEEGQKDTQVRVYNGWAEVAWYHHLQWSSVIVSEHQQSPSQLVEQSSLPAYSCSYGNRHPAGGLHLGGKPTRYDGYLLN